MVPSLGWNVPGGHTKEADPNAFARNDNMKIKIKDENDMIEYFISDATLVAKNDGKPK
jgi:hypothetical protein